MHRSVYSTGPARPAWPLYVLWLDELKFYMKYVRKLDNKEKPVSNACFSQLEPKPPSGGETKNRYPAVRKSGNYLAIGNLEQNQEMTRKFP